MILKLLAAVGVLVACSFISTLGNGLFHLLVSVRLSLEGHPASIIGPVVAFYSLGFAIGAQVCPRLIRPVGHVRAFAAFAAVAAIVALAHPLFVHPIAWAGFRVISGFVMAGIAMIAESWVNAQATNKTRGQVLAIYQTSNSTAFGSSQFLLGIASPLDYPLFTLVAMLLAGALVPLSLTKVEAPPITGRTRLPITSLYRVSPLGMVGAFSAGLMNSSFNGLGPVYAQGVGFSVGEVSRFMGFALLAVLLLQWPMGRLSDKFDRRRVMLSITAALSVLAAILVFFPPTSRTGIIALVCVYSGLTFTLYPLSAAHTNDFVDSRDLIPAAAGLLFVFSAGATIGPFIASSVMSAIGPRGLFAHTGTIATLLTLFGLYRMTRRAPKPKEEQGIFVPMPAAPPVVQELNPRADRPEKRG
jgi:MFS family permease